MTSARKHLQRVYRLHALDQGRLGAIVAQIAAIDHRLEQLRQKQSELTNQKNLVAFEADQGGELRGDVVNRQRQSAVWMGHLDQLEAHLRDEIVSLEEDRNVVQERIVAQKAKVRGWESLIERLRSKESTEIEKTEAINADDRYLSDQAGTVE